MDEQVFKKAKAPCCVFKHHNIIIVCFSTILLLRNEATDVLMSERVSG